MKKTDWAFSLMVGIMWLWGSGLHADDPPGVHSYAFREMDMHLHAGLEREVPLNEWLNLAAADGRKAFLLLDHLELYRMKPKKYARWARENHVQQWYPMGAEGHRALMADFDNAAQTHKELTIFTGWEIAEFELDEGLETAPMKLSDVIGWHISPNHDEGPPDGRLLIKRIKQIKDVQKQFPIPMIIFHPFSMRLERVLREAKKEGKSIDSLTVEDCRFFKPGEQEEVIRLLKDSSLYIEMARGTEACWSIPVMREALIADIKPLAEAGVKFTVSTDNHTVKNAQIPFHPERYCEPCGITLENVNALISELMARKTQKP